MNAALAAEYAQSFPTLDRLRLNLESALQLLLKDRSVSSLAVYGRVKTLESLREKVDRKSYDQPMTQAEDLVGLRVIVYFPNDILAVNEILNSEFIVHEQQDKADLLQVNEVGYRSFHSIISIKDEWAATPNYRGLQGVRAEVQVRTVLMHAWAEVEHKLQYKHEDQVPSQLRRQLFLLSAKFEEADLQFQSLKEQITSYQNEIATHIEEAGAFDPNLEVNLDTFKQFLIFHYPEMRAHAAMESSLFEEVAESKLTYAELIVLANKLHPHLHILKERFPDCTRANAFLYAGQVFDPDNFTRLTAGGDRPEVIQLLEDAANNTA